MKITAVDIGGANLKIADGKGFSASCSFPLWKEPARLAEVLGNLLEKSPTNSLAVTMTGELADCFASKAEGVATILDAVEHAAAGCQVSVYLCDGRLVDLKTARADPLLAAASNWHALAQYVSRFCGKKPGLLMDIGSTTTDLIPLSPQGPASQGRTDPERLIAGELLYTGVERSPVCALVPKLTWRGEACPVAQELFATTLDAYLLLNDLAEDETDCQTADRRSRTTKNSQGRLARMVCADTTTFSLEDATQAAEAIQEAQLQQLASAAKQVLGKMKSPPAKVVISGQGEFLARRLLNRINYRGSLFSLSEELGPEVSCVACAHALAILARERAGT